MLTGNRSSPCGAICTSSRKSAGRYTPPRRRCKRDTGASDRFKVTIEGQGGHASKPHQTIVAIVVANQVINSLQTVVSREVDPLRSAVLTIGKIRGGTRYNAIAQKATLEGTIRTFGSQTKKRVKEHFHSIVGGVAESMEASVHIRYSRLLCQAADTVACGGEKTEVFRDRAALP